MSFEINNLMDCTAFEDSLTDYLDRALDPEVQKAAAEHVLSCPLCHSLLNEVRSSLAVCRELAEPKLPVTRLEAMILERTMPQSLMPCVDFEEHLTDYLDGFLPANVFHRWERHAVLCDECSDLPGTVVRSLAACVSYKLEEFPVPAYLHDRILRETIGTAEAAKVRPPATSRLMEWFRSIQLPISIPQLAPVAMMLMFALLVFSQTVSADGSLTDVYSKSVAVAEQTYQQGAGVFNGSVPAADDADLP